MSSMSYRPEIDGLRAIAVIPVVLFHLNSEFLPGGFIGVDVFFVISGFLITSLIANEYELGVFNVDHIGSLEYQKGIQLINQLTDKYGFCRRVAIADLFIANAKVWVIDSHNVLYIDDDHLSYSGALKAKDRIVESLQELLTREY